MDASGESGAEYEAWLEAALARELRFVHYIDSRMIESIAASGYRLDIPTMQNLCLRIGDEKCEAPTRGLPPDHCGRLKAVVLADSTGLELTQDADFSLWRCEDAGVIVTRRRDHVSMEVSVHSLATMNLEKAALKGQLCGQLAAADGVFLTVDTLCVGAADIAGIATNLRNLLDTIGSEKRLIVLSRRDPSLPPLQSICRELRVLKNWGVELQESRAEIHNVETDPMDVGRGGNTRGLVAEMFNSITNMCEFSSTPPC